MTINIAINGYGRIGRNVLRAIYENKLTDRFKVVAINNLSDPKVSAHLTQYDSTHGYFDADIALNNNHMTVNGDEITLCAKKDPSELPWAKLGVNVVFECTGKFTSKALAQKHIDAGAKKVLISAPGKDADATVVYGVNHDTIQPSHTIVSNASCTTNCLAPMAKPLHEAFGIESGLMNTIHAFTNDQMLVDAPHRDLCRARSATLSMIPTKTGAANAVGIVMPELAGKLDGFAVRVPTINVSLVDFTFVAQKPVTVDAINQVMRDAATNELKGILAISELPLVSIDFNHHPASSVFDTNYTKVVGQLVKVTAWYDNEWGFSNRMLDTAAYMMK